MAIEIGGISKTKSQVLRDYLPTLIDARNKGKTYRQIIALLLDATGLKFGAGHVHGILRKNANVVDIKSNKIINITPEQLQILNDVGSIRIHDIMITSKKYCCSRLRKYARYRGKLVVKFKMCPFCGDKR